MTQTTRSPYARKEAVRCWYCGFQKDTQNHYKTCVSRKDWPKEMFTRKVRHVINGLVYNEDQVEVIDGVLTPIVKATQEPQEAPQSPVSNVAVCQCGWVKEYATSARAEAGMRLHMKSAAIHRG